MSKVKKALAKIRNNPRAVRFDDLERILLSLGFNKRQKGSHVFYVLGNLRLSIPEPHPSKHVLPIYVKQFLALLDELPDDENE
jgi:predicted RNA binding protein YcfA (HicA-like mRNA interferase family)